MTATQRRKRFPNHVLGKQYGSDQWAVDEKGLFYVTTQNPRGKWENWGFDPESDIWAVHSIPSTMIFTGPKSTIRRQIHPTAVLTPDGHWHDLGADGEATGTQHEATGSEPMT